MNKIGRKIIRLESVDSTNNYAANSIKEGKLTHGSVILADEQFSGRGQRNSTWTSNPGENLTISVFWDEVNLSVTRQFELTQFVALAMIQLLERFGINALIKWPNDILVGDRKIAGILNEAQVQGSTIKSAVIGIGLNVNQQVFGALHACSIYTETGKRHTVDEVLYALIEILNKSSAGGEKIPQDLSKEYVANLFRINQLGGFEDEQGNTFTGVIQGVTPEGKLAIRVGSSLRHFSLKEVRFIL